VDPTSGSHLQIILANPNAIEQGPTDQLVQTGEEARHQTWSTVGGRNPINHQKDG